MGISFVCPNCTKPVDPTTANAVMHGATKQWQHRDCALPAPKKRGRPAPTTERRQRPRGRI